MVASTTIPSKLLANLLGGETAGESVAVDILSDNIAVTLHTSAMTLTQDTLEFFSDLTSELATANGYTAGGQNLGTKSLNLDTATNRIQFRAANTVWTAAGGSIGPARYAVVRKNTGVASTSPVLAVIDFGADQTATDGNPFTIAWDATQGVFYGIHMPGGS